MLRSPLRQPLQPAIRSPFAPAPGNAGGSPPVTTFKQFFDLIGGASRIGLAWNPRDLSTLRSSRTTGPFGDVTAGGVVGTVLDSARGANDFAGPGIHAVAASDAARPTLVGFGGGTTAALNATGAHAMASSAALNLSAVDEVHIWQTVRALSNATNQMYAEHGTGGGNGLAGVYRTSTGYIGYSKGTVIGAATSAFIFGQPDTAVLYMRAKISTDEVALYRNGVLIATQTGDQGTGNYLSNTLRWMARTSSTLFATAEFGPLLVVGGALTAEQIAIADSLMSTTAAGSLNVSVDGNSIYAGYDGSGTGSTGIITFASRLQALPEFFGSRINFSSFAISGASWSGLTSHARSNQAALVSSITEPGRRNVLVVGEGTNAARASRTGPQLVADTAAYIAARKADNPKLYVVLCSGLPLSPVAANSASMNAALAYADATMQADPASVGADMFVNMRSLVAYSHGGTVLADYTAYDSWWASSDRVGGVNDSVYVHPSGPVGHVAMCDLISAALRSIPQSVIAVT